MNSTLEYLWNKTLHVDNITNHMVTLSHTRTQNGSYIECIARCEQLTCSPSNVSYYVGNWTLPCDNVTQIEESDSSGYSVANVSGVFWLCGERAYKSLPVKWARKCTLGIVTPDIELVPVTTDESLWHRSFFTRTRRSIPNPLIERPTGFHAFAR